MPLYEYVCRECGEKFEALVRSFREDPRCPACRSGAVEKQLSSFAVAGSQAGAVSSAGGCGCGRGGCGCRH